VQGTSAATTARANPLTPTLPANSRPSVRVFRSFKWRSGEVARGTRGDRPLCSAGSRGGWKAAADTQPAASLPLPQLNHAPIHADISVAMSCEAEEWLEPLDWIESDASVEAASIEEISERGFAAWSRLLARLQISVAQHGFGKDHSQKLRRQGDCGSVTPTEIQ
jgi:hypothetical protein